MGKRGPKPKGIVSCVWRPELAYCIGLIASDGCLSSDGRHVELTSMDREQIEHFQQALGLFHIKIGKKKNETTTGKRYFRIQFGDVLFYRWLTSIGLTPHKSKTIGALVIPDEYFFDFFRGLFDGDGSVYSFWDKRWVSSYMYYITITSASPIFILWLQERIFCLCGEKGAIHQGVGVQDIRFAKKAVRTLVSRMYADKKAPCLTRKFAKVQKIFTIDSVGK